MLVVLCATGYIVWDGWNFLSTSPSTTITAKNREKSKENTNLSKTSLASEYEVIFDVLPGASFDSVARKLEAEGIVTSAWRLKILGHWLGWTGKLQAGRFALATNWTPKRVLDALVNAQPILYRLTLREGLPWWEVATILEKHGFAKAKDIKDVLHDPDFLRKYGIPFTSAEGFLFPDTYLLRKPRTLDRKAAEVAVGRLIDTFWMRTAKLLPHGKQTPREELKKIVTLASIVEKETSVPAERGRVAGVYANRLRIGMILQADPTIIYGLGASFDGNLTRRHLRDKKNPYNTYQYNGLPPGPICSPGYESIKAAITPDKHKFLYFVARKDGTHQFSTNLADHNRAVRHFQLGQ